MSQTSCSFEDFHLDPRLTETVKNLGYVTPTPIQQRAIPIVLQGVDVMGAAQTGTGKTAGYGLPSIHRILNFENTSASPARHPVRVLVLTPTRELADQVDKNLKEYAAKTSLRLAAVYGGVDIKPQCAQLMRGVEILTATPGRLLDHVEGRTVNLSQVQIVILDEADRMLDMGFLPDISRILNLLPKHRQNLMFSATFSPEIKKLAKSFLVNPQLVEVDRQNRAAETVEQSVYEVDEREKTDALIELLQTKGEDDSVMSQVIVFVNAKLTCRRLTRTLQRAGIKADSIHGDKTQEERMATLEAFKKGDCDVLVATDVAARGLDIVQLPFVINYDVPFVAEDYVHRIGRTGRAGLKGRALMLSTKKDTELIGSIETLTKQKFTVELMKCEKKSTSRARRDRYERDRDHEGRVKPEVKPMKQTVYDPIFDEPYVPSGYVERSSAKTQIETSVTEKKKKTPISVLLRGMGRG